MKIVEVRDFTAHLASNGMEFDPVYPEPKTINYRVGHGLRLTLPTEIYSLGILIAAVLRPYRESPAVWLWRRSGNWGLEPMDEGSWRARVSSCARMLGAPARNGALLFEPHEHDALDALLLLMLSVQRSVGDDLFVLADEALPIVYFDHDGYLFLDCPSPAAANNFRAMLLRWA